MLIYLILPLILIFTTLAAADSQETAQKTIERILANHEADSISEWEELMETAAKELSESLPSIASGNSLNAALNQLLENPGYSARQISKERQTVLTDILTFASKSAYGYRTAIFHDY